MTRRGRAATRIASSIAAAIASAALLANVAFAARPHVVIVGPSADHVAVVRVRGELALLGIDVDVLVQPAQATELESVARRVGAIAAIRVETGPPAIVLWVDPAVAPAGVTPTVRVGGAAEEKDPPLLALRAVEVLRARLVKVPLVVQVAPVDAVSTDHDGGADDASPTVTAPLAPAVPTVLPTVAAPPPPPAVTFTPPTPGDGVERPPHPERIRRFALSAAPGVMLSPGGVSPAFEVRVGAEWDPIPRLGIEINGLLPATAGSTSTTAGSVDVRMLAFGGGLRGLVTDPASPFSVAFGLGVDAAMLAYSGNAAPPLMAESGTRWGVAPYATASAGYRVHPMVALRLDLLAAIVRPEPVIRAAGQQIASFGLPAVMPSLGLEVRP